MVKCSLVVLKPLWDIRYLLILRGMLLRHDRKSEFGDEFLKGGENVTPKEFFQEWLTGHLEKRPKIDFLNSVSDGRSETTTASSSSRRFRFAAKIFVLDVT
jgi:hypothetical protein